MTEYEWAENAVTLSVHGGGFACKCADLWPLNRCLEIPAASAAASQSSINAGNGGLSGLVISLGLWLQDGKTQGLNQSCKETYYINDIDDSGKMDPKSHGEGAELIYKTVMGHHRS